MERSYFATAKYTFLDPELRVQPQRDKRDDCTHTTNFSGDGDLVRVEGFDPWWIQIQPVQELSCLCLLKKI